MTLRLLREAGPSQSSSLCPRSCPRSLCSPRRLAREEEVVVEVEEEVEEEECQLLGESRSLDVCRRSLT